MDKIISVELNASELALILNISEWTVKKLAARGDIPCEYKNRRPRFNLEAVINRFRLIEEGVA
ncbi:MAG: hypothetical protein Pg6A_01370 [Termitinemataceae bacterium]|jgi:hypothetical protein|nr:MAG: hypothetical protein Pg6A_01370 [Termitinemataceae bacterium]